MNKQILRLAIPFIISNLTVPLVSSVDTSFMGHFGSTVHLGALGLGSAIFNFIYWNFAFIRMSVVGMTAQAFGADNQAEAGRLLARSLTIAFLGAFLLLLFSGPIGKLSFHLAKGEEALELSALSYYQIRILAAPATLCMYAFIGWFIGMQNAKAPMFIAIAVNVINLSCNYYFVAIVGMKSEGVAWGSVIAEYAGLFIALVIVWKKYRPYLQYFRIKALVDLKSYGRFFRINLDVFIRTLAVISVLTWYNFASADKGALLLGMNVIFLQMVYAFSFFSDGFANAAEALTGKFVCHRDIQNLKKLIGKVFIWGAGIALAFTFLYAFAWESILGLYTSDAAIVDLAQDYIGWVVAIPLVSILTFVWDGVYLGATSTTILRNITLVAAGLFFASYMLFDGVLNNHALLLSQVLFFAVRGILQTIFFNKAIIQPMRKNQ